MTSSNMPLWLLFYRQRILCLRGKQGEEALLHSPAQPFANVGEGLVHRLGAFLGYECLAQALKSLPPEAEASYALLGLREAYATLGPDLYKIAGKAQELIHWDSHTRFCPACGTPTRQNLPVSKICPACGYEIFPNIAVACIVLVQKEDSILLVRSLQRPQNYGLVAGFLEVGETLEDCALREIQEETALQVANLRYFGSQSWPYPSGLMAGFTADYLNGEITIQKEELADAAFFSRDRLPPLPATFSIARKMINAWIDRTL